MMHRFITRRTTRSLVPQKCRLIAHLSTTASSSPDTSDKQLPDSANVTIIGGGIIGASVAYHLSKLGVQDIILLERDQLTSGTTW